MVNTEAKPAAPKVAKATKAPKAAKAPNAETTTDVKLVSKKYKRHGNLLAKAVFIGYKHGLRNQYENQAILNIEGARRKKHRQFYVGKRCAYLYKAETKKCVPQHPEGKTPARAVWGKVTRIHANTGSVRAHLKRNLPGHAI